MSNIKARETANDIFERIEANEKRIEGLLKRVRAHFTDKVEILKVGKGVGSKRRNVLLSVNGKTKVQYL